MSAAKTVTMQQIADAAGVSKMTVSRALKDHPHLADATKQRIRKIAEDMGYAPHPYISALMSHRARTSTTENRIPLAIFHFAAEASTRRHLYFQGIEAQAHKLGYKPELFHYAPEKISPDRLRKILISRGIRGIILMPAIRSFEKLDFNFDGFAAIAMGHTIASPPLPRVGSDVQAGVFLALEKLLEKGYKRIGLINTETVDRMSRYMYVAALTAFKNYSPRKMYLCNWSIPQVGSDISPTSIRQWVERKQLDAVISSSFDMDLYLLLKTAGFRIPESLGYVHLMRHPDEAVTRVNQPEQLMGIKAVNQVTAAINQNDFSTTQSPYLIGLAPEWHEGRTLRSDADTLKAR
ncbi:LacI family DNA-binding transcriptional regulator [Coraliomargarita parva]|uniref:LacI family DNA-binding transcriptional regulator n=1 Tax=Coraliomargarita parva TaxID=3014050 RepID=UPI0022B2B1A7|nr:LacI family DNA-binding transcriptional regulator [Coraliomargarita parva]